MTKQTQIKTTTDKLVDELLSQVNPKDILSKYVLFSKLKKRLVERVLQSELDHELGYGTGIAKKKRRAQIEGMAIITKQS